MAVPRARPLLGDGRRTWAGLTLAACVIVVVVIGLLFRGQTGPDAFDNAVDSPVIAFFSRTTACCPGSYCQGVSSRPSSSALSPQPGA